MRWVTLNRPGRKNAIPPRGWEDLLAAMESFETSDQRVLVITGSGGDFCSGADLTSSRFDGSERVSDRHRRMKTVGSVPLRLARLSKPTIAAVDGVAVGAGMNLALACDLVVATDRARFAEIFVKRGLALDSGGSWLLPRIVGLQRAKELALTGRFVEADEAVAIGLALESVSPDELDQRVTEIAGMLVEGAPLAQSFIKKMLNASFESGFSDALTWEAQAQSVLMASEDLEEGVRAFREKRNPRWMGR